MDLMVQYDSLSKLTVWIYTTLRLKKRPNFETV